MPMVRVTMVRLPATPRSASRQAGGDEIGIGNLEQPEADALREQCQRQAGYGRPLRPGGDDAEAGDADEGCPASARRPTHTCRASLPASHDPTTVPAAPTASTRPPAASLQTRDCARDSREPGSAR